MTESNSRGGRRVLRTLMAAVVMAAALAVCSFALEGTVDASILNVRSETSVKSGIVTKIARGDNVEILSRFGNWYKINAGGKTGFVFVDYIDFDEDIYVEIGFGVVSASSASSTVNIRMEPSVEGERVTRLLSGTKVRILGYTDGWYYVRYAEYVGYISADYLKVYGVVYGPSTENDPDALDPNITEDLPNSSNYATIEETISPADVVQALEASPTTSERTKIVEYAMTFIGTRYVYGGASPSTGFDCSGLMYYVLTQYGYSMKRVANDQMTQGTAVSRDNLQVGDLVFFGYGSYANHVGMYIGNGNFVHASTPSTGVRVNSLNETYYNTRYIGARRII